MPATYTFAVPMRAMKWRPVDEWVTRIVSKATGNLGAVQILLGDTKIESIVRYLGVDIPDALKFIEVERLWHRTEFHSSPVGACTHSGYRGTGSAACNRTLQLRSSPTAMSGNHLSGQPGSAHRTPIQEAIH